jgi:hypothetical protein
VGVVLGERQHRNLSAHGRAQYLPGAWRRGAQRSHPKVMEDLLAHLLAFLLVEQQHVFILGLARLLFFLGLALGSPTCCFPAREEKTCSFFSMKISFSRGSKPSNPK